MIQYRTGNRHNRPGRTSRTETHRYEAAQHEFDVSQISRVERTPVGIPGRPITDRGRGGGRRGTTDRRSAGRPRPVVALQEAGSGPPPVPQRFDDSTTIPIPGIRPHPSTPMTVNQSPWEYRGRLYTVSFLETHVTRDTQGTLTRGGQRVNLAVVTQEHADGVRVVNNPTFNPNSANDDYHSRRALGILLGNTIYYNIHARGASDYQQLLVAVRRDVPADLNYVAVALAVAACRAGYSIYFTSLDDMVRNLKAAEAAGRLLNKLGTYLRPSVLVVDEVGHQPLERAEANLVFQVISKRYETGSIILTTSNKTFSKAHMLRRTRARCHRNVTGSVAASCCQTAPVKAPSVRTGTILLSSSLIAIATSSANPPWASSRPDEQVATACATSGFSSKEVRAAAASGDSEPAPCACSSARIAPAPSTSSSAGRRLPSGQRSPAAITATGRAGVP